MCVCVCVVSSCGGRSERVISRIPTDIVDENALIARHMVMYIMIRYTPYIDSSEGVGLNPNNDDTTYNDRMFLLCRNMNE